MYKAYILSVRLALYSILILHAYAIDTHSLNRFALKVGKGSLWSEPFKVRLSEFWFGTCGRLSEGHRIFFRWDEKARCRRHCSQTKSIFNFTDFYRSPNCKQEGRKEGRSEGRQKEREEKGEKGRIFGTR